MRVEQDSPIEATSLTDNSSDARRFFRVCIHLPVAIRRQDSDVLISESLDISEGGILVKNNQETGLKKGDCVKVHIEGILGEDLEQMVLHPMRVIRVEDDKIALEFT
ncbi:PilZ domain-containing protein [Kangiella sp. HD9-110m-PIT-SAG07]|nr:PilZ domain-containing protein [Kangiella sp. HD9-110m-PIT-SAG07]